MEYLDIPRTKEEETYQHLLYCMSSEMVKKQNDATAKMTDLREYYTMWVHQIKTPIQIPKILLQHK